MDRVLDTVPLRLMEGDGEAEGERVPLPLGQPLRVPAGERV